MWLVVSQLVSQETVLSSFLFTCTPQTFITAPVISRTFSYDSFAVVVCVSGGQGMVAQLLALPPHSKKVMGSIPAWGAVGSGGQVLPRVQSGLSPGPFCVEFACSPRVHKGFPPL